MSEIDKSYDFAGWVTKNDIRCSDGVVIKHDAFKDNDKKKVPLVWNHNHSEPTNVLGHVVLHNLDKGVYGYGYFNDSEEAQHAKALIEHGDISSMSIGANRIKKQGTNVVHGRIYEVSLVLAGANPGALIESVVSHSDNSEEEAAVIYTGTLLHSADDVITHEDKGGEDTVEDEEKTIGEVIDTLNEEQLQAVTALLAGAIDNDENDSEDEGDSVEQNDKNEDNLSHEDKGGEDMKHNVFNGQQKETQTLQHSDVQAIFNDAHKNGSLKEAMLEHGISDIELLFPEAKLANGAPHVYRDRNTAAKKIVDGTHKSPFSKVKTLIADLTPETARARGYVKGNEKFEQVFGLLTRTTDPQTIYKKQKLDRDDIVDITDFDIVGFINQEMRDMLIEELARAIIVGDGRDVTSPDKIKEDKIRPIVSDDDLYTIKRTATDASNVIEVVIKAMAEYEGAGNPTLYAHPQLVADLKLLKAEDGRFLFGDIPTAQAIAARLGVKEIVETTFLSEDQFVIVNLNDYTIGATRGGEITRFEDFDIDFNQHKYLIETRLSGALTKPKTAIAVTIEPETPVAE